MGVQAIEQVSVRGGTLCRIRGALDEMFDPSRLAGEYRTLVIDLDGVTRVTSFGVRQWMAALRRVKAEYCCYINCRPSVVAQFNTVDGFGMDGELVTLYVPYLCADCDTECQFLLDLRTAHPHLEDDVVPDRACPSCGGRAFFDDAPDVYFYYAMNARQPAPPPAANAIIDGRASPDRPELSIKKRVEGTVTGLWLSGFADRSAHFKRLAEGLEGQVVIVMQEADGFSNEGMVGFRRFLEATAGSIYLARVPAGMLDTICDALAGLGRNIAIASLLVPLECATCQNATTTEIDAAACREGANAPQVTCWSCGGAIAVQPADILAKIGSRARFDDTPTVVRSYLQECGVDSTEPFASGQGDSPFAPGELVQGKYRIERVLGRGGMGEVALALQIGPNSFEKPVVLKRMRRDRSAAHGAEMFMREARLAARLSHPNIAQILDFARTKAGYFMVMEFVNGLDLGKALHLSLEQSRMWSTALAVRVVSDVCSALQAAHSMTAEDGSANPVIHRDVSPSNILLSTEGAVKLADFGIAKAMRDPSITEAGVFVGKVAYSAPEQLRAAEVDLRVDIFAAGVVLYETLTLRRFDKVSGIDDTGVLPSIRRWRSDVPEALEAAFLKAVAPDRNDRHDSARAFQAALEGAVPRQASMAELAAWVQGLASAPRVISTG